MNNVMDVPKRPVRHFLPENFVVTKWEELKPYLDQLLDQNIDSASSLKNWLKNPDMKLPIQYALSYPQRISSAFERFNFMDYPTLTFEKPDTGTFRCLNLAYEAMKKGGNAACVLNAANEVAVNAFLNDKISFLTIAEVIEKTMEKAPFISKPSYADYVVSDKEARILSAVLCK